MHALGTTSATEQIVLEVTPREGLWFDYIPEILYLRDDALLVLYISYVMLIWAAPIPADRWHCSLWP